MDKKSNKIKYFGFELNFKKIIRRLPLASPTKNWKIKSVVGEVFVQKKKHWKKMKNWSRKCSKDSKMQLDLQVLRKKIQNEMSSQVSCLKRGS